jgi:hypothetical protein
MLGKVWKLRWLCVIMVQVHLEKTQERGFNGENWRPQGCS